MSYLFLGIAYIALHVGIGRALSGHHLALSIFGNLGLRLPPLALCAIVLYRRRSWRGCQHLFRDTIAIGLALWVVGHLGWA
ncbi:MAG TPA: hypothetical protein VG106_01580, partial [Vicinamibacterales bacterium]|nr:hypothetical protein [Vicinamibacterales bacterium]